MQFYDHRTSTPNERDYNIRLLGTGAADPTKQVGQGVAVTRTAAGVFKVTFAENPGFFVGFSWGLGADTPGDVKGHTVTRDTYDATAGVFSIEVSLWSSSFSADELNALEYMDLVFRFAESDPTV